VCEACEFSRRTDPAGRARFEAEAPAVAAFWGVPVQQLLCRGYADEQTWAQVAGLNEPMCRKCGHGEDEHSGLGCRHWITREWRTDDAIHTDGFMCHCSYFHGPHWI
jgi:hypothetical protein